MKQRRSESMSEFIQQSGSNYHSTHQCPLHGLPPKRCWASREPSRLVLTSFFLQKAQCRTLKIHNDSEYQWNTTPPKKTQKTHESKSQKQYKLVCAECRDRPRQRPSYQSPAERHGSRRVNLAANTSLPAINRRVAS